MIKGIFSVNIAVNDLKAATQAYERLLGINSTPMGASDFAFPDLRGSRFRFDNTAIYLIASETNETSVAKFLASRGEGVFLVSLRSDDAEKDVMLLKQAGVKMALAETASGPYGKVNFIHPKFAHGVQFEIYELPISTE